MMKMLIKICNKATVLLLIVSMLVCGCASSSNVKKEDSKENNIESVDNISFTGLDDTNLQDYVMENLYSKMNASFTNEDYTITNLVTTYVSKEYIEELDYNSKSNVYFGFDLKELASQFNGKKYVFEVGKDNQTTVVEFIEYEDIYAKMLKNVAIGTGVILVCVTVSVASGGTISIIFAASAKTAAEFAVTSALTSGILSSAIEYYKTGDLNKALDKGMLEGSEGFKWGAIIGGVTGGFTETITQVSAAKKLKTMNPMERGARAEARAQQKYGGRAQISYLNGKEVSSSELGATRPDLVRNVNGHLEAIEVKNYNLDSYLSRESLYDELHRQVSSRVINLPKGSTQRIVLDIQGRNYSKSRIKEVYNGIKNICSDVYPDIPVEMMP